MMILNPLVVCYKFCVHYMPDCIKLLMHFESLLTSLNRVDDRFYVAAGQGYVGFQLNSVLPNLRLSRGSTEFCVAKWQAE